MDNLRILIADDHQLIRRGVRDLLAARPTWTVVAEVCNGREAIHIAGELQPDVAILDFSMPEMNGPEAASKIAQISPSTRIIILTMHDSEHILRQVLESGAKGFVLKSDADQTLLEAVEVVAQGRRFVTAHVAELLLESYLGHAKIPQNTAQTEPRLTEREQEVLTLLACGMTNRDVADRLRISVRTAESHRININRKLNFRSLSDLVRYAIRSNIVSAA